MVARVCWFGLGLQGCFGLWGLLGLASDRICWAFSGLLVLLGFLKGQTCKHGKRTTNTKPERFAQEAIRAGMTVWGLVFYPREMSNPLSLISKA